MARLSDDEIKAKLAALQGWERAGETIRKRYAFDTFKNAVSFVNRVAAIAEELDHHPDILIEYNKVTLTLTSHDSGGLTGRDFRLADRVDT
jgi:4a-hydroxytetrahydrobiopterin dehydratase